MAAGRNNIVNIRLPRSERRKLTLGVKGWIDGTVERAEAVISEYAEKIWEEARDLVPVDTGNLRSTIEIRLTKSFLAGIKAMIGTDRTTYAIHVEYGTQMTEAQPYIRPAFKKYRDEFVDAIADVLDRNRI